MLSPTYEITTALRHTDELISPPYDIAIVNISYGRVTMSSVWDSMMSKKNMGWPFYAAVVLPSRASYGVLIVKIWERIGRVKMSPHWTCKSVLHDFIPESRLILAVWNWVDEVASLFQNIKLFTWHTWPLRSHQRSTECNRRGLGIPMVSKKPLTIKCSHLRDRQS